MNFLDEYRPKIEDELKSCLAMGSTPLLDLNTMNAYHLGFCDKDGKPSSSSKGKYLRPLFCIAMCAGLGGDPEQAVPAAAALELVHRTSLIFDDIQDKGQERNNQPTMWAVWGADQAINAGLALSCYARLSVHRLTLRNVPVEKVLGIASVLENAVIDLCHGQCKDISFVDAVTVSVEDYLRMVGGKTAALFGAACEVGAMLASPDDPVLGAAREFGINMGMAFQIHDDYLGVWGDEALVGKTANDIQEKKRSLPIVLAMQLSAGTMRNWLKADSVSKQAAIAIRDSMEQNGIPESVKRYERRFIQRASRDLESLSLGKEWQDQFEEVLDFLSERKI